MGLRAFYAGSESLEVEQALVKKALFKASSLHDNPDGSSSASDDERAASGFSDSEPSGNQNGHSSSGSLPNRGRGQALHPDSNVRGMQVSPSNMPVTPYETLTRPLFLSAHYAQRSSGWRGGRTPILLYGCLEQGNYFYAYNCQDDGHYFRVRASKTQQVRQLDPAARRKRCPPASKHIQLACLAGFPIPADPCQWQSSRIFVG